MKKKEILGYPFIRWAGGKRWFTSRISKYLPTSFTDYYEPFLGGGSIFFSLSSQRLLKGSIFLSDFNSDLISAYLAVRDNPENLISDLSKLDCSEEEYYSIRELYNERKDLGKNGCYFIYLNRTGFNGIYRVSRTTGNYNVPYGDGRGIISDEYIELIKRDSALLRGVSLQSNSFESLLDANVNFKPRSLFFIDPPYTVSHNNNGFIEYNKNLFNLEKQYTLLKLLDKIDSEGCYFIMTNAHHDKIREIFNKYDFFEESRVSIIGGTNAKRGSVSEYIVCNFNREEK